MVTASRRAAAILEPTSEEVLTVDCRAYAVSALASALEACSPEMEASLLASSEASAAAVTGVGYIGVHLQRCDPRRYVQGVLVHHRLEAVVGGHRGQRGVVGRGDGAVHGRRGAGVLFVATTPSSTSKADWSALLERPVVSELCSAAMLLPCAATCPSVVARAAAVARGAIAGASALLSSFEASSAVTLSSRNWMAAALLPDAAAVTSPLSRTSRILPVTGPSNMFTYVLADALVQWLRRRPRS